VKVLSEMLGHASVSITLDLYAHVLPHMQQQAAVTMDDPLYLRSRVGWRGDVLQVGAIGRWSLGPLRP